MDLLSIVVYVVGALIMIPLSYRHCVRELGAPDNVTDAMSYVFIVVAVSATWPIFLIFYGIGSLLVKKKEDQ